MTTHRRLCFRSESFESLPGFWRESGGSAIVEFAIILPMILLLVLGLYDFGKLFWIQNTLQFAAEQTARYAMTQPSSLPSCSSAVLQGTFDNNLAGVDSAAVTTAFAFTAAAAGSTPLVPNTSPAACQVTATYNFSFLSGFLPFGTIPLVGQSTVKQLL
jgi:Flp pilus assembly protein TadG